MQTKFIVSIVVVIVVIFGGFIILGGSNQDPSTINEDDPFGGGAEVVLDEEEEGEKFDKAPNFSLEDIDGNTVSLSDFEGRVVVANSWAVWCPFCVDELPDFGELQEEFGNKIVVIAINRQESLQKTVGYTDNLGVTNKMLWLLDPRDSFYKSIGGFSMPETLFIDTDQNIVIHKRGPMELEEMISKVNSVLEQE